MRIAIRDLARRSPFDVTLLSGKHTWSVLRELRGVPLVADICDATSVRLRGKMKLAGLLSIPVLAAKWLAMRGLERSVLSRSAHAVFASGRDRDAILDPSDSNGTIVPNGVDLEYWKRSSDWRGVDTIVFTGAMHYPPNADAAAHLIRDIFPQVRAGIPAAKLMIVGRDPGPELLRDSKCQPGVTVTGFVDDIRPFLDRATVFAAPLRFGAGIQNKVLEALAMQVPVIASPSAAAGVRTANGLDAPLEVVEGGRAFAQALIRQLQADRRSPAVHPTSREYVGQHFSWQQSAEKLERILSRVADCSWECQSADFWARKPFDAEEVAIQGAGIS
jgi:glycosyltransferase involved in cell wall biosynthesis